MTRIVTGVSTFSLPTSTDPSWKQAIQTPTDMPDAVLLLLFYQTYSSNTDEIDFVWVTGGGTNNFLSKETQMAYPQGSTRVRASAYFLTHWATGTGYVLAPGTIGYLRTPDGGGLIAGSTNYVNCFWIDRAWINKSDVRKVRIYPSSEGFSGVGTGTYSSVHRVPMTPESMVIGLTIFSGSSAVSPNQDIVFDTNQENLGGLGVNVAGVGFVTIKAYRQYTNSPGEINNVELVISHLKVPAPANGNSGQDEAMVLFEMADYKVETNF